MSRQLLFMVMIVTIITSCRTENNLMISPTKKPKRTPESLANPYLLLENGNKVKIDPKLVTNKSMAAKTISNGDTTVNTNDVRSIVIPKIWATKIPKKEGKFDQNSFANMIFKGKYINVYASINTKTEMVYVSGNSVGGARWEHRTRKTVFYYMQNGDDAPLQYFNYENLRKAIPENNPASNLLDKYVKEKSAAKVVHLCGGAAMLSGIAVLATGGSGGGALLFGGLFTYTIGGIMKSNNIKNHFHKAFYLYNKDRVVKRK